MTGCQPLLRVYLASEEEHLPRPGFVVEDPDHPGERPRYNTIKLAEVGGELIWHLRAEPFGDQNSVAHFAYGQQLTGFTPVIAPRPLRPNHDYTLMVIGKAHGSLRFRTDSDGKVHALR